MSEYQDGHQDRRNSDLILAQGEYALLQDGTNGQVQTLVGPYKHSIAGTDQLVKYVLSKNRFVPCQKSEAIQSCVSAREGQYVVLHNPTQDERDGGSIHPPKGRSDTVKLHQGRKVVLPGPVDFALFPGQAAEVLDGHQLRSNQYLVVRVYNEDEARKNWGSAVVKSAEGEKANAKKATGVSGQDLTIGQLINIKGTEVSYYIPPNGIEVVPDSSTGDLVREALTLQRLTYCILLGEDGEKRYVRGPAVVFPEPTEKFVEQNKSPKYKAIELNDNMGLYIKVISDYEENGKKYKAGDELFITGKEQRIYFMRAEHSLIRYGKDEMIHYSVAIPKGEARYVLNKETGEVKTVCGPLMYLPNPIKEVIVRRILDPRTCGLWFPGNQEALEANLQHMQDINLIDELDQDRDMESMIGSYSMAGLSDAVLRSSMEKSARDVYGSAAMHQERKASDAMTRNRNFTPPRSITLNTKYDGAVAINVWTGYAIQIVNRAGDRRVVEGPATVLLEYDETLEVLKMSTGKPKNTDNLLKTVYLRVKNNKISDIIHAQTSDLVDVEIKVSYTTNFEGDPEKWFDVENYVKFLCDHMRSILRNKIKRVGIEEFISNTTDIVRDTVLGAATEKGGRPGRTFEENGMRISDVDVLATNIGDARIGDLLVRNQHSVVEENLRLKNQEIALANARKLEVIERELLDLRSDTQQKRHEIEMKEFEAQARLRDVELTTEVASQDSLDEISTRKLVRRKAVNDQDIAVKQAETEIEVSAHERKMAAVTPDLIAALEANGEHQLATMLAQNLPQADGQLGALLGVSGFENLLSALHEGRSIRGNGSRIPAGRRASAKKQAATE